MSETYSPDNLIAGGFPVVGDEVTIAPGADLTRGAVVGKITATGAYKLTDGQASDGSESPKAIAAEAVAASGATVSNVPVYLSGAYNQDAISLGGTTSAADVKEALRDLNIYLKAPLVD